MALIHAWRAGGATERLIGTCHSNVRYWDLRYCFDRRDYAQRADCALHNYIGSMGSAMRVPKDGCPAERLIGAEALRYLYWPFRKYGDQSVAQNSTLQVSVLTRLMSASTRANGLSSKFTAICFRKRLTSTVPLSRGRFARRSNNAFRSPFPELLALSDVAYASSVTSAAVEALFYLACLWPYFDPASLNMSPLEDRHRPRLYTPEQLACAILKSHDDDAARINMRSNFYSG